MNLIHSCVQKSIIFGLYSHQRSPLLRIVILTMLIYLFNAIPCYNQTPASIKNLDFELLGDKLVITYEITDYKNSDRFKIFPQIYTAANVKLETKSISGDLDSVKGGPGKKIIWDLSKDNITLDNDIYVMLYGFKIAESGRSKTIEPDLVKKQEPPKPDVSKALPIKNHSVSRTACFFESLLFPGWGTSRLTMKNAHFIKGVLGYGTIIASYVFTNKANESYDLYKKATSSTDRDSYYSDSEKYTRNSQIFAYGAAAIWGIDLISVLVVKNKTIASTAADTRICLGYALASVNTHQLTLRITF